MATVSYITPSELLVFYDANKVLMLASDSSTPATATELANSSSTAYGIVYQAIQSAAGEIDSHCQIGRRYSREDLETIADEAANPTGSATVQAQQVKRGAPLRRLTADLAFGFLMARRGYTAERMRALAPQYEGALMTLERLLNGLRVFDMEAQLSASSPSRIVIGSQVYRPSLNNRMFGVWSDNDFNFNC